MFNKKKILLKWLLICIGSLTVILITANIVVKRMIEKKLDATLNQFQPYLVVNYKHLSINLLTGSFKIDSLYGVYSPHETQTLKQHKIYIASADMSGINYFKLISGKTFSVSDFQLNNCSALLNSKLLDEPDTTAKTLLSKLKLPFQNVEVGKFALTNAVVKETNNTIDQLFNADLAVSDIKITNVDSVFSRNAFQFSKVECTLNDINYPLPGYHTIHIKSLALNSEDSILKIDSLRIIPQLGKVAMGKKLGHQTDHVNALVPAAMLSGLDFKQLSQKKIIANELNINDAVIYIFRDRRLPRQMKNQPTSAGYLKQIPFNVYIDHFKLKNTTATSEEFPKEGEKTGYIKITDINVTMEPFFNKPQANDKALTAMVKGNIMNAGTIHANIHLSLSSGIENIKGAIEDLHLTALNPSAENLGKFHIESGVLDHLDFSFSANNKKASGEIIGVYHDLVVDRLKITKDGKVKKASIPSFALKTFIIPKNKDASMPVKRRTGKIDFDRDPTRLVTFFYIKSLLDGIRNSFALGFLLPS